MSSATQSIYIEFGGQFTGAVGYELSGLSETNSEGLAVDVQIISQPDSAVGMYVFLRDS